MKILFISVLIVGMAIAMCGYKQPVAHALQKDENQENQAILNLHENADTADIEAIAKEIRREKLVLNPLTQKMIESSGQEDPIEKMLLSIKEGLLSTLLFIREYKDLLIKLFFAAAAVILAFFAARNTVVSDAGITCTRYGFLAGRLAVIALAPLALLAWFVFHYNFFAGMGIIFMLGLLSMLLSSAVSLRFQQGEEHIWNRLIFSVVWPTASGVIIHFL